MKIIIFGGSGFVGSHIADALSEKGHEVSIFDIVKSPYLQKSQKMILGDINDKIAVEKAVTNSDIVYHFAGMVDIEKAHLEPLKTIESNVIGTVNILEACRKNKVKRFIFASTIYVYSDKGSFYRSSKQACELIIDSYNEVFNVPYTILRYGSLYGPRANEHNWIYKILKQALTEGKITRHGDGEEIREYIHVKDAAKLSIEILNKEYENQNVIITGQQPMKIKDLLIMIGEILNNKIKIEYISSVSKLHYEITPYCFKPKAGKKLVAPQFYDLGQGILEALSDINKEINKK